MKRLMSFWMISFALVIVSAMPLAAKEFVIFDDELVYGNLTVHDGGFEISNDGAFEGKKCLSRELIAGEWAWITGIENMGLDLTGIEFDDAFIEFYIDSEDLVLDYIELRLAGQGWNPDCGTVIQTDGADGYEQIRILLSDFEVKDLGEAQDLDDFTGGTNKIDRWSIGFSPAGDTTVRVDNLRIADSDEQEMQAVKPTEKLTTSWAAVKSSL
jgi:hypothetical protein